MGTTILTHFLDGPSPWQDFSTVIQFCIKYSEAIGAQLNHANLVIQTFANPSLAVLRAVQYATMPSQCRLIRAANFSKGRSRCHLSSSCQRVKN
jgi:hypothetical protein